MFIMILDFGKFEIGIFLSFSNYVDNLLSIEVRIMYMLVFLQKKSRLVSLRKNLGYIYCLNPEILT